MFNPRFPHTLRIWRTRRNAYGEPETDDEGNPLYDPVALEAVVMRDGFPVTKQDGSFETEVVYSLPFGYRTQGKNTRDTSDVVVSDFKLATPMFLTPLDSSDVIELEDYDRKFACEVVKKATFNLGSNIWVNEVKN